MKGTNMQIRVNRLVVASVLCLTASGLVGGCASTPSGEQNVTLAKVSEPARATINKETAGGQIEKITKEIERGKTVYDVEATVGGKHLEYLIADADGAVLGTEVPIPFEQLPAPVRVAAENYFGASTGLAAMKGVEYGETHFEIEGMKHGKKVEVTFDPEGRRAR